MKRFPFLLSLAAVAALHAKKPEPVEAPPSPIAAAMQGFVDKGELAGAVTLVWSGDKLVSHEATGFQDLESKTPMAKDSLFWIASMTKPITAMGVMMLVEEGKLGLDDPVEKHLPEFRGQMLLKEKTAEQTVLVKPTRAITIKDLLTHTSGLVSNSPLDAGALDVLTLKEAVITYALSPLQFEPGSKWSYCNPGINTLGRLIEVASGDDYAKFMERRFFKPLKMNDTTFWPSSGDLKKRLATSYNPSADGKGLEATTVKYLTAPYSSKKRTPLAAGGLFSTAEDLLTIYRMVLNGGELDGKRYLSTESLKLMTRNHTGDLKASFTDGMGMGLGFHVVVTPTGVTSTLSPGTFGHGGAHGTQGWSDPVKKSIHILLIQRAGLANGDASPMRQAFHEAFAGMQK
jgi:CubicO group peptidase (beta-lactamase class C family)